MARITTAFSSVELNRLIDGLEGTAHLDEGIDKDLTQHLLRRLVSLFDQSVAEERQPFEVDDNRDNGPAY
jgi:hypothetical protein